MRCSKEERARWKAKAAAHQMPLSEYLRAALDGAPSGRRRAPPAVDHRLLVQVARAGNNLNQIARALNAAHRSGAPLDALAVLAELIEINRALRAALESFSR
ncbi:hypothetical protein CG50_07195 [Paenirhodobacter enshiensis]|uniref:Uncharacterized protein n=1 Tax=Paenirhodobacter enshiensis TaxID=1105367 RepID=A0A086XSI2_9RHOB|nr:hypothetical protein CG50_07195 [Paenirhodobacter enshiensis]